MWLVRTFRNSNSNDSDRQHLEAAASRPRQATDWSQPKPKSATAEREREWERKRASRTSRRMFVRGESDVSLWSNMQTSMYGNKVAPLKCPTRVKKESSGRERVAKTAPERERERDATQAAGKRAKSTAMSLCICACWCSLSQVSSLALYFHLFALHSQ